MAAWDLQTLAVAPIVGACAGYAVWVLMPSAWRRALARAALRLPLPTRLAAPLRRAAQRRGCSCDGCDHALAEPGTDSVRPLVFQPRPRR